MSVTYLDGRAYVLEHPSSRPGTEVVVATPVQPARERTLVVVGDSFSIDQPDGRGWARLVADSLGLELVNLAVGGSGYVAASTWLPGGTFGSQVTAGLHGDPAVTVVFGGYNDATAPKDALDVREAARTVFAAVRRLTPRSTLVVVGPQWPGGSPSATVRALSAQVQAMSAEQGAVWVDPLDGPWLADPALIGPDRVHPNGAGQAALAARLRPVVAAALADQ